MEILSFRDVGLTYQYDATSIFDSLNFAIEQGKRYGILIEAFSGKTTCAKLMAGLLKETKGEIRFAKEFNKHNIGIVFSDFALMEKKSVFDNISYPLKVRKVDTLEIDKAVEKVLNDFNLTELKDIKTNKISLLTKLKVCLARLSVRKIELLIVDDCLAGFDELTKPIAKQLFSEFAKNIETVVFISDLCDIMTNDCEIIVIDDKTSSKILDLETAKVYTNNDKWNMAKQVIIEINKRKD